MTGCAEEDIGRLDVAVDFVLAVQVVKPLEELTADDGRMTLREDAGLEEVVARSAGEVLHDNPQLVALDERSKVARDVVRVALGQVGDLGLNLGDVVVRVLKIDLLDGDDLACLAVCPARGEPRSGRDRLAA